MTAKNSEILKFYDFNNNTFFYIQYFITNNIIL